jgi:hypothetical protein
MRAIFNPYCRAEMEEGVSPRRSKIRLSTLDSLDSPMTQKTYA